MSEILNIYCDESCHLIHDGQRVMTLGAMWCPLERRREISVRLREIKTKHGIPRTLEVKWGKVSPAKVGFYEEWLDYFFDDDDLHFRAVIVPDKGVLRHEAYAQSHDDWYYKMYFVLLSVLLKPENHYRIYIDQKDTRSAAKAEQLHRVLCNNAYDFDRSILERVQAIASHDSEMIQLTDLLIGTISYVNRGLAGNSAKERLVARMRQRSGYDLTRTTLLKSPKVNLLVWREESLL